jgi:hypothetical protein
LIFKKTKLYFKFRSLPHILWKPAKMNEGLNILKKESE